MARFENKRVLITGGTSGMGLAGAKRIVAEGGSVIVTGLSPDRIDGARRELGDRGQVSPTMPLILPASLFWSRRQTMRAASTDYGSTPDMPRSARLKKSTPMPSAG